MVKLITLNGQVIYTLNCVETPSLQADRLRIIDKAIGHLKRNQAAYTALAFSIAIVTMPSNAFAANGLHGGKSIILLMQKASFWLGMGITIWGIVEAQLDYPGWRGRILKGILGYVGILVVPLIFLELQNSLQVDVWNQIDNQGGVKP